MAEPGSAFSTRYDAPVPPAAIPGTVALGSDPSLQLTDGVIRQRAFLARVMSPAAVLGVRVESPGPLRAEVLLSRMADDPRPNLVEVRAGDATGLVLARPARSLNLAAADRVVLEVAKAGLPEGGLLLVEVLGAADRLPPELRDRVAPRGAEGVRVLEVRLSDGGSAPPAENGPRGGRPTAAGVLLVRPGARWPVRLAGRFVVPPPPPAARPSAPVRPKAARAQLPPAPRVTPSAVAQARAATPQVTAATPPEPPPPVEVPAPSRAGRFTTRIRRGIALRTPVRVQRVVVGVAGLVPSGGGEAVAIDLSSGTRLPVRVGRAGAGVRLSIDSEAQGPVLVLLPAGSRRGLLGWRARWIDWRLRPGDDGGR